MRLDSVVFVRSFPLLAHVHILIFRLESHWDSDLCVSILFGEDHQTIGVACLAALAPDHTIDRKVQRLPKHGELNLMLDPLRTS